MSGGDSADVDTNHRVDDDSDDGTVLLHGSGKSCADCLWVRPGYAVVTLLDSDFDVHAIAASSAEAHASRKFIEAHFVDLLLYRANRAKRHAKFLADLNVHVPPLTKLQIEAAHNAFRDKETLLLRSRRLDGRLSDFLLVRQLGRGAYGKVFLARHKRTGQVLALKQLAKETVHMRNQLTHVHTERQVLGQSRNEWLVHLHYTFQDHENIYFAMDYVPGGDLRSFLFSVGNLEEAQARTYAAEMLEAIDFLHRIGYVHRDLKPDNFLIDRTGHLKLADFGLSKRGEHATREPFAGQLPQIALPRRPSTSHHSRAAAASTLAPPPLTKSRSSETSVLDDSGEVSKSRRRPRPRRVLSLVGTPSYMAVEMLNGSADVDRGVDFWALGVIVFEMIVGDVPFTGETPHEVFQAVLRHEELLANPLREDDDNDNDNGGVFALSDGAWSLVSSLVCDRDVRLDAGGIRRHRWFAEAAEDEASLMAFAGDKAARLQRWWETLADREPEFVPVLDSETDTSYFIDAVDMSAVSDEQQPSRLGRTMSRPLSRRRGSLFDRIKRAEALGDAADVGPVARRVLGRSAQLADSATGDAIASIIAAEAAAAAASPASPASPALAHEPSRPKVHRSVMSVFSRLLKSKSELSARDLLLAESEAGDGDGAAAPPSINIEPLSLRDWKVICTGAYTERFNCGELIVGEDAPNSALFRIQSGTAVVLKNLRHAARLASGEHETIEISQLHPGDWLGEMSFIAHGTENAYATSSVRVTSASATVYVVPHDYVLRLFACDTAIFARFFYTLALLLAQRLVSRNFQRVVDQRRAELSRQGDATSPQHVPPLALAGEPLSPRSPRALADNVRGIADMTQASSPRLQHQSTPESLLTSPRSLRTQLGGGGGSSSPRHSKLNSSQRQGSSLMKMVRRATMRADDSAIAAAATTPEDDAKFVRRFSLPEGEVIASTARCQLIEGKRHMHGKLYVSKNFACFVSRIFGSELKRVWSWRHVGAEPARGEDGHSVVLVHNGERHVLRFQTTESIVGLFLLMCDLWQRRPQGALEHGLSRRMSSGALDAAAAPSAGIDERMLHLTQYDWDLILDGATMRTYQRDEVVVAQGDRVRRIYQIGVGRCRVEVRGEDGAVRYLGSMQQPDMFGEVTFLGADDGVGASVTVVADDNEGVDVYTIEASYIDMLFVRDAHTEGSHVSGLAGRFYNFLAGHLGRRIRQREAETLASLQS